MNKTEHNFNFDEIQQGEEWLAGVATPTPSARAITSTKAAMRAEFVRLGHRSVGVVRWHAWHGALAAAACIALCVTVGWRMNASSNRGNPVELVSRVVTWPEEAETQLFALSEIDESLSAIEESASDAIDTADGAALYEVLSNAVGGAEANRPAGSSMRTPAGNGIQSEDTI